MLINEKVYKRKSPEALALELTVSHYLLFLEKDLQNILERNQIQSILDTGLAMIAKKKEVETVVRQYVA